MGKSKKRIFHRCKYMDMTSMTRDRAIEEVILGLQSDCFSKDVLNNISMFGLSAEELSESGAKYEDLMALKHVLN